MERQRVSSLTTRTTSIAASSRLTTTKHRVSLALCAVAFLSFGGGLSGCHDDPSTGEDSTNLASRQASADCVEFQGIQHCALGAATLTPREDGKLLEVGELSASDKDGVSVVLPDVTSFVPTGRIDGTAEGAAMTVTARSGGNTIGTMNVQRLKDGYRVSATFTGDGSESVYNVNLYSGDVLVGSIARQLSTGGGVVLPHYQPIWWYWWYWWYWPSFWNIQRGPNAGGCVWELPFARGDEIQVVADGGKLVVADRIELEEVVNKGGSYPYLTFDRIDYTTGGRMLLESESLENTH